MYISNELFTFSKFVIIGIIISIIFDFFRAYRKTKKVSNTVVIIQDIIYFIIATIIVTLSIIFFLDSVIRLYIFVAIIIGCLIYLSFFSKYIMKFYINSIKTFKAAIDLFFTPIRLFMQFIHIIYNFLEKYIKKCCKMIKNMVLYLYKRIVHGLKKIRIKKKKNTKEGSKDEKSA